MHSLQPSQQAQVRIGQALAPRACTQRPARPCRGSPARPSLPAARPARSCLARPPRTPAPAPACLPPQRPRPCAPSAPAPVPRALRLAQPVLKWAVANFRFLLQYFFSLFPTTGKFQKNYLYTYIFFSFSITPN